MIEERGWTNQRANGDDLQRAYQVIDNRQRPERTRSFIK